jgi:hypothetical protein
MKQGKQASKPVSPFYCVGSQEPEAVKLWGADSRRCLHGNVSRRRRGMHLDAVAR